LGAQFQQIAQKTVHEMQKHAAQNKELHSAKVTQPTSPTKAPQAVKKRYPATTKKSTTKATVPKKTTLKK
jgi:hypothetical protein